MVLVLVQVGTSIQLKFVMCRAMKRSSRYLSDSNKIDVLVVVRFPVDRWLDPNEGDKRISLDLEPDKKPGQLKCKNDFREALERAENNRFALFLTNCCS